MDDRDGGSGHSGPGSGGETGSADTSGGGGSGHGGSETSGDDAPSGGSTSSSSGPSGDGGGHSTSSGTSGGGGLPTVEARRAPGRAGRRPRRAATRPPLARAACRSRLSWRHPAGRARAAQAAGRPKVADRDPRAAQAPAWRRRRRMAAATRATRATPAGAGRTDRKPSHRAALRDSHGTPRAGLRGRPYDARMQASDPVEALAVALADVAGAPVDLERPSDAQHGDYATNVALRLAGARRQPPRDVASELAEQVRLLDGVAGVDVAGPGFLNVTVDDRWLGSGLACLLSAGTSFGGGSADPRERVQVELVSANPTGPVTVASARNGAYGDAVARLLEFAGHDARARVLLQRRRDADGPVPRVRRGDSAGRRAARGRISRRLRCGPGPRGGRPCTADARADRGGARALSHPLRHVCERQSVVESRGARGHRARSTPTRRTARSGRAPPRTATTRTACSCAPTASRRTSRPTRRTSAVKFARVRAARLRARRRPPRLRRAPPRHWPRCSATRGSPSRC